MGKVHKWGDGWIHTKQEDGTWKTEPDPNSKPQPGGYDPNKHGAYKPYSSSSPKKTYTYSGGSFSHSSGKGGDDSHFPSLSSSQYSLFSSQYPIPPKKTWKELNYSSRHGKDTYIEHFDEDGPTPERKKLHQQIIDKLSHKPSVPEDKKPVAILTMGIPGSGKSAMVRGQLKDDFVLLDPDSVREHIPEFHEAVDEGAKDAALRVERESVYVAKRLRNHSIKERKNILLNGMGNDPHQYAETIKHLKKQGYHVQLMMPHCSAKKAIERAKKEGEKTGRWVAPETIAEGSHHAPYSFAALAEKCDDAYLINADKEKPSVAWSKEGEEETAHDPSFVKKFKHRYGTGSKLFQSEPSLKDLRNPKASVSFTKDPQHAGEELNGVPLIPAQEGYWNETPDAIEEPPLPDTKGKKLSTGVLVVEPDGRVWMVEPANHYGGYRHTFPKGGVEKKENLTPQQNALKETYEESGLQAEITDHVGDFPGDTSITRYYLARRTGGVPWDADWESQAVKLMPMKDAAEILNRSRDQQVIQALQDKLQERGKPKEPPSPEEKPHPEEKSHPATQQEWISRFTRNVSRILRKK